MSFHFDQSIMRRLRLIQDGELGEGPVLYWMSREQRASDSWPLLAAARAAHSLQRSMLTVFCFSPSFSNAQERHYSFLCGGLSETEKRLFEQDVKLAFLYGEPGPSIASLAKNLNAALIVSDFDPLPAKTLWQKELSARVSMPIYEVDGHNIVPAWTASPKREYSAATFRKKITPLIPSYMEEFPPLPSLRAFKEKEQYGLLSMEEAVSLVKKRGAGSPIKWILPGTSNSLIALYDFLAFKLTDYDKNRNNPALQGVSNLSPWLHFGQLSAQRAALESLKKAASSGRDSFLEELIVRKELADNFCLYEPSAGTYQGLPEWGRKSLAEHAKDERPKIYTLAELEEAKTEDLLWNAAQKEMLYRGKMHGWMRMYWAKKILEWSASPEEAFERALMLNDKYELDGRDPNGIVGVSWAIGGLHDRPWMKRPVFGLIRYMNDRGAARKFKVKEYIALANSFIRD